MYCKCIQKKMKTCWVIGHLMTDSNCQMSINESSLIAPLHATLSSQKIGIGDISYGYLCFRLPNIWAFTFYEKYVSDLILLALFQFLYTLTYLVLKSTICQPCECNHSTVLIGFLVASTCQIPITKVFNSFTSKSQMTQFNREETNYSAKLSFICYSCINFYHLVQVKVQIKSDYIGLIFIAF